MSRGGSRLGRAVGIVSLIVAAEAIFTLPYHVVRFFRPTLLLVLDLDNTQLGLVQAGYGIVAMVAYLPGGPLADLFPARKLLTASLLTTGLGGIYFATLPDAEGLWLLFAFWGLTTILLFWAALIRATREWGSPQGQGFAYGMLDGGRGLLAAFMASLAVVIFALFFPDDSSAITNADRVEALRGVILFYTGVTLIAALLTWLFVSEADAPLRRAGRFGLPVAEIRAVLRMRAVWLQVVIVVCAYAAYKGIDYYSFFAVEIYGMSEVEGARVTAASAWLRPLAALAAGMLGDRIRSSRACALCFGLLAVSTLGFLIPAPGPWALGIFFANVGVSSAAAFGLRGLYFALLEEAAVPAVATGTAVGIVSVIGYAPDVFFGVLAGWLLDAAPGVEGQRHYFGMLFAFVVLGFLASVLFSRTSDTSRTRRTGSP